MTLWSCVLYAIANLIGMGLYWYHRHQKAIDEVRKDPNYTERHQSREESESFPQYLNPWNFFRRQTRPSANQSSLLNMLGLTYNGYSTFYAFEDRFSDFEDVGLACQKAGLETCGLIVGVDFSASNEWQGRRTFQGRNLHTVMGSKNSTSSSNLLEKGSKGRGLHCPTQRHSQRELVNPYQKVLNIMARTIESLDEDHLIPAYGFGDNFTAGKCVFPFKEDYLGRELPCQGFHELLDQYREIASQIILGGPTNFAPIIYKAIDIVKQLKRYHILIIIADGQVTESFATIEAIVEASYHPLSIVMVGVGDGPWDKMEEFDDCLPERSFDNFQFVNYHEVVKIAKKNADATFALHAMMEIPDQYKTIKALGYLDSSEDYSHKYYHSISSDSHRDISASLRDVLDSGNSKHLKHNVSGLSLSSVKDNPESKEVEVELLSPKKPIHRDRGARKILSTAS